MEFTTTLPIAVLGGVLPALFWLVFWLKEDEHPEPRSLILLSFLLGMLCVVLVLPFQYFFSKILLGNIDVSTVAEDSFWLAALAVFLWASTEEIFKYIASHIGSLRMKAIDEPMDWVIYMISTALGFSAAENTLFLINPLAEGDIIKSFATGNFRFLGATLLHVVCSATIGIFLAFAFYKSKKIKAIYKTVGIIIAISLHTLFNLTIIMDEHSTLLVFGVVWLAIIFLILLVERIKKIKPEKLLET